MTKVCVHEATHIRVGAYLRARGFDKLELWPQGVEIIISGPGKGRRSLLRILSDIFIYEGPSGDSVMGGIMFSRHHPWIFKVYGRVNLSTAEKLAKDIAKEFNIDMVVRLVSEESHFVPGPGPDR